MTGMSNIVPIGALSHRFALEAPLLAADGAGGGTVSWSLVAELWGSLRPASGSGIVEADARRVRMTHEIWLRHRSGLTPEMRLRLGTRIFEIRSIVDVAERRRFLRCLAEERIL